MELAYKQTPYLPSLYPAGVEEQITSTLQTQRPEAKTSTGKIHAESLEGDDGVSDEEESRNLDFNRSGGSNCQYPST